jgi:adenine-specific DNA-methyltransferase
MNFEDTRHIAPVSGEQPSSYAERLGESYAIAVSHAFKKGNGQFFTPQKIAGFMGSLASTSKRQIDILDPGCGAAILTCSLVENIVERQPEIEEIRLVAYETDYNLISLSEKSLSYLKDWLSKKGISFQYVIHIQDFILANYNSLNQSNCFSFGSKHEFDFIISNPPYFKLSKEDDRVKVSKVVINGQPNIYSLFLALASRMLKDDGEMIFIVPRSFTSGRYFSLFRNYFFQYVRINFIHLFDSRKDTFAKDNVLQETLILRAVKKNDDDDPEITVSTCNGLYDIEQSKQKKYFQKNLIDYQSKEKIIHLPTSNKEEIIIHLFKGWNGSLNKYNIQISTGPVVAFRAQEHIKELYENGVFFLAPLYWLHNVVKMEVVYPLHKAGKGQYIQICKQTKACLIPNRNYVFLRRFSAKDDKSRLIAAPYFSTPNNPHYIGVENKLNYIYRPKGHLERTEVMGVAALLNSNLFDTYFRTFNGNVNVSATELRGMPMPPLKTIMEIGKALITLNNFSLENVNKVVNNFFELKETAMQ